jgi:hypothetical protein
VDENNTAPPPSPNHQQILAAPQQAQTSLTTSPTVVASPTKQALPSPKRSLENPLNRKISSSSAVSANSFALHTASLMNATQKSQTYIANNKKRYKRKYGGGGGGGKAGKLKRNASAILRRGSSLRRKSSVPVFRRDSTINSKIIPFLILIKETRTAFMLFVVSIVFIACYLPSILATRSLLPNDNLYIVYLYFCNSALNPIIYSFMNRNFRCDLKKLFLGKRKPVFSASRFSSLNAFSISLPNKFEMKNF